jgi:hypothetical protein
MCQGFRLFMDRVGELGGFFPSKLPFSIMVKKAAVVTLLTHTPQGTPRAMGYERVWVFRNK